MSFPAFVALRYLRPRRGRGLVSAVSAIAVGGFGAGVAALVIALAVTNGFRDVLQQELVGATAQVNLVPRQGGEIPDYAALLARLEKLPHVAAAAPVVYDEVFLSHGTQSHGAVLKGVMPRQDLAVSNMLAHLSAGDWRPLEASPAGDQLVLGKDLADQLGVAPGDSVNVYVPNAVMSPLGEAGRELSFEVCGVYASGFADFDSLWAYTSLRAAQSLRPEAGQGWASALEFRLDDIYRAPAVAAAAESAAGPQYAATTWIDQNKPIFQALRLEQLGTVITISLVVLVAALNVLILLTMLVLEKRKEIAVLLGLGAGRKQIGRVFIYQGVGLAALGTACGLAVGFPVAWLANRFQWIPVSADVYSVSYIPFHPHALDGAWVAALALAVGFVATLYPARRAVAIRPAETLRYE